jgi:hypothetical protein
MKIIPEDAAKYIAAKCDLDVVIIYGRKSGNDGGEQMTYAGSTYKNKRLADEMVSFLKSKVFGWSDDIATDPNPDLDTGPDEIGKKIILDGLARRGRK